MNHDEPQTDENLLREYGDTAFVKRLGEKLAAEQIAFVIRLLKVEDYCGSCFEVGGTVLIDQHSRRKPGFA